jgi:signal transduction histidine kinase
MGVIQPKNPRRSIAFGQFSIPRLIVSSPWTPPVASENSIPWPNVSSVLGARKQSAKNWLDDLGLVPALRSLLDQQGRRASVAVRFSAENMSEYVDPEIQTTCFRIAQEAITNAVRHADATRIGVDLQCENGNLRLLIRDNGIGFDVESAQAQTVGLGLIGIKERAALVAGQARIISSPKKGTTIEVSLPLVLRGKRAGRG